MWLLAWSFAGWACLDLNQGPLPYQFKDSPRSEASTSPWSVVAICPMGWVCDAVAVIAAVNDLLIRRLGQLVHGGLLVAVTSGRIP